MKEYGKEKLLAFERKVLRKIYGPDGETAIGGIEEMTNYIALLVI
jgi:hypothetical protein